MESGTANEVLQPPRHTSDHAVITFGPWDYVIFGLMLCISAGIGVYYALCGGKQKTTKEFLLANRQMNFFPVAMSLIASFISAITLLGTPTEVYFYGTQYCAIGFAYFFVIPGSAHIFMPIFYKLRVTSAYEYLSMRFNRLVRLAGAITFSIHMALYMGIVLYTPSLALNAVTGLSLWGSVITIGLICAIYTSIGGIKAVLWTDTFQISMMVTGVIAVLVKGSMDLPGGFGEAWTTSTNGKRIEFFNMDPNPLVRHTFWTMVVGGAFTWGAIYSVNQAQVQRALTCKSLTHAKIAYWINLPGLFLFMALTAMAGIVIYGTYEGCDPLEAQQITKADQLFPHFVLDKFGSIPGLPGLCLSGVFSGALSTLSSGLNSLAAVTLSDMIRPFYPNEISDERATLISKIVAFSYGLVTIGIAYVVSQAGTVLEAALALFGVVGGPFLGLFILGMFFPFTNSAGGFVGLVTSLMILLWISFTAKIGYKLRPTKLPISVDRCNVTIATGNLTDFVLSTLNPVDSRTATVAMSITTNATTPALMTTEGITLGDGGVDDDNQVLWIYRISYMYYSLLAIIICVIVGIIVSLATGPNKAKDIDPRLVSPLVYRIYGIRGTSTYGDSSEDSDDEMQAMYPGAASARLSPPPHIQKSEKQFLAESGEGDY